jgi:hypothetical protein
MRYLAERSFLWVINNPAETAVLGYAAYNAPIPTAKIAIEVGKLSAKTSPMIARTGLNIGRIVLSHSLIARGALAVGKASAPVAVGLAVGAVGGVALSTAIFGAEGNRLSREFYSGQANLIDYVPAYNAYKIVKHYVTA